MPQVFLFLQSLCDMSSAFLRCAARTQCLVQLLLHVVMTCAAVFGAVLCMPLLWGAVSLLCGAIVVLLWWVWRFNTMTQMMQPMLF